MEKALENQVKEYFIKNPSRSSVFLNEDETEYQNHKGGGFDIEVKRKDLLGKEKKEKVEDAVKEKK